MKPGSLWTVTGRLPQVGALLGVLSALGACGSPPAPDTVVIDNSLNVTIEAGGKRAAAPATIDLGDPRIAAAQKRVAGLLGHPLGMEFDATLVKTFGDDLFQVRPQISLRLSFPAV